MKTIPLILSTVVAVNAIQPALFNIRPRIMTQTSFISKITNRVDAIDKCKMCVDVSFEICNNVLNIILSPRTIGLTYVSKNGTGTGQIVVVIHTIDGVPVDGGFLNDAAPAGTYHRGFNLKAQPDPDCDPSQEDREKWLPGDYTMHIDLCTANVEANTHTVNYTTLVILHSPSPNE
ncbi:uncharacterized protein LOC121371312 [Gigantopelta aegis]|uniref:uncharacterized protein LOC121371312 n=1 Tax=Gigantopelta aegis TaxID=1735272 RepID=UPI001B888E90|nr:uncharacterized protein LOC121371312 [Gigantopelta aegis]